MKTEFISYEQALALKELGFDEPCLFHILGGKINFYRSTQDYFPKNDRNGIGCSAILYQQAFRWLYQKLDIEKGVMPLDIESQQLLLKELVDKVSSKHLLV